jgi:hypothetical protein
MRLLGGQQHRRRHTCLMECTPMAAYGKDVRTFATRSNLLKSQQPGPCSEQQQECRKKGTVRQHPLGFVLT